MKHAIIALVAINVTFFGIHGYANALDEKISLSWFRKNLCEKKVTTIEHALSVLPESYRNSYTLMSSSPSLQKSTPEFPRAILFGNDASFILTFNGSKTLRGYDSIEISQFNSATSQFEYREIKFPSPENKLNQPYISKANPAVCLACHGTNPRPNWDQYSIWPNAYGGNDDALEPLEQKQYANFVTANKNHPRYKWLVRNDHSLVYPYHLGGKAPYLSVRPNLRFMILLARLNALKIAARLTEYPQFLQKIVVYLGSECDIDPQNPHLDLNQLLKSIIEVNTGNTLAIQDNIIYYRLLNHLGLTAELYTTAPFTSSKTIPSYRFSTGDDYGVDVDNFLVGAIMDNWKKTGQNKYEDTYFRYKMAKEKYFENNEYNRKFLTMLDSLLSPALFYLDGKFATLCDVLGTEILQRTEEIEPLILKNKDTFLQSTESDKHSLKAPEREPLCP